MTTTGPIDPNSGRHAHADGGAPVPAASAATTSAAADPSHTTDHEDTQAFVAAGAEALPVSVDAPPMSAADAQAAEEIGKALSNGIILSDGSRPFFPLRDRWAWGSVGFASLISALLIAQSPSTQGAGAYLGWVVVTSIGSAPVAFGMGLLFAWLARLVDQARLGEQPSARAARFGFALGSVGIFLLLALGVQQLAQHVADGDDDEAGQVASAGQSAATSQPAAAVAVRTADGKIVMKKVQPLPPPPAPEAIVESNNSRHQQRIELVQNTMHSLFDEINEEYTLKQKRAGKDAVKALVAPANFVNAKAYNEGRKRLEQFKQAGTDYEQRVMARYDHFMPRLKALEIPSEARQQVLASFEKSKMEAISKMREMMMYERTLVSEMGELYNFMRSRAGKFQIGQQIWFKDAADLALYNTHMKRINELNQQLQKSGSQLHEVVLAKLSEVGKSVQWASIRD